MFISWLLLWKRRQAMRTVLIWCLIMTYCKTLSYAVAYDMDDKPSTNNVFVITLDGFRWQELFSGADSSLLDDPQFTQDAAAVKKIFWNACSEERRKMLMPFFWSTVVSEGQIFGNRNYKSCVNVSNNYALSYPGYNEIFTGNTDPYIFSNRKIRNRNITMLEYLNNESSFKGRVVSFASWDMFPYIFNQQRSGLYVNSHDPLLKKKNQNLSFAISTAETNDPSLRNDAATYFAAKEYILAHHPQLVHIGLSGTDTYGHRRRYDDYLYQANLADKIIGQLWQLVQSSTFYRNRTTFIITTDHGRGSTSKNWYKHGLLVKGSSQTWLALLGNGVRKFGEYKQAVQLYQKQIAGTIGYFLNVTSYSNYSLPINYFTAIKEDDRLVKKERF